MNVAGMLVLSAQTTSNKGQ